MAKKGEVSTRLVLQGEQEFRKGMTDAANAIKVLDSEQRLAQAQFEATGDAQQYAAEKARILREKIAEQKKAVAEAQKAVEQLTQDGVDPNNKAMQEWRTKLNNANTKLYRMQNELSGVGDELQELNNAKFDGAIETIDALRDKLGTIIKAAASAGKALWEMEVGAGTWADELATAAQVADMDVETYQAWQYASRFVDTSVDSIIGSYKRLNKNLDEPTDDMLKSLNELGVATLNFDGTARDSMDVFWDVIDALGTVDNKSRKDQLAMELLGKSFDELNPLIAAGSKTYKDYVEEGRAVAVVSEENVNALTTLNDANQKLDAVFTKTKETLLSELAPAFTTIAETMSTALSEFNAFLETEEGQEALANLNDAFAGIADKVASIDFKAGLETAKTLISGISTGLEWISNHKEVVVGAIGAIGGAFLGLTVSGDVLSVLQLINTIRWAKISKLVASGAAATPAASAAAGAAGAAGKAGFWSSLSANIGSVTSVAPMAALAAAGYAGKRMIQANLDDAALNAVYGGDNGDGGVIDTMSEETLQRAKDYWQLYSDAAMTGTEEAFAARDRLFESLGEDGFEQTEQAVSLLENAFDNYLNETDPDGLIEKIQQRSQDFFGADTQWPAPDTDGFTGAMDTIVSTGEGTANDMPVIGGNVSAGFAQGIRDRSGEAIDAAQSMAQGVAGILTRTLQIKSPSRVMEGLGEYVSEGFAIGIESNLARVDRAVNRMVAATTAAPNSGAPAERGGNAEGRMVHITLVMDGREMADVITPYVDSNIGAQLTRRR